MPGKHLEVYQKHAVGEYLGRRHGTLGVRQLIRPPCTELLLVENPSKKQKASYGR